MSAPSPLHSRREEFDPSGTSRTRPAQTNLANAGDFLYLFVKIQRRL